jgi:DNA invertase Pin-like site-specific DNA recombinase
MNKKQTNKAVLYCRVSSLKQTTHGSGLASQETRCREFAKYRGLEVVKVFTDDMSGSLADRPGMKAMLAYLRQQKRDSFTVIIDDISRLARGLEAHLRLRAAINAAGAVLASPSVEFGEDSDSQLVENLLASVSQHQRQKNGEQTRNRMRARVLNGYWVFQAPWGYRYERVSGRGKMLVRHEPLASVIEEALEGYASGRFDTQAEVKRFLESHPCVPRQRDGTFANARVTEVLTQPLYAGFLEAPRWDVSLRKAQHAGLISFQTFQRIQERLRGGARVPAREDIQADFPLRGFVCCADCDKPLTGSWSRGSHSRFPYYSCFNKNCGSFRKSIPRSQVEGAFEQLLKEMAPSAELMEMMTRMIHDLWEQRVEATRLHKDHYRAEVSQIDRKIAQLLDRIMETDTPTVVKAYEQRIAEFETRKLVLQEKLAESPPDQSTLETTVRTALQFLASPWNLWMSDRVEDKRAVLKLTFKERLGYSKTKGLRTPELSFPFKLLTDFFGDEREMARPERFERPTLRFVV